MAMWRKWLDPYITVHHTQSSAFLPVILKLPSTRVSVHIAIYLPTHGKDAEFVSELADLKNCLEEVCSENDSPLVFIRGDGNCNAKNIKRFHLLQHFIDEHSLTQVAILHPTYHHFVGDGLYDSNVDVILHSKEDSVTETILRIICRNDHPEISSHHDIIISQVSLPHNAPAPRSSNLLVAPRTAVERRKILWTEEGTAEYLKLISSQLHDLRLSWLNASSRAATSVLMQCTNDILNLGASTPNPNALNMSLGGHYAPPPLA